MEVYKGVKVAGTLFSVGEVVSFSNFGLVGMHGLITFVSLAGGAIYIFVAGNGGVRIKRNLNTSTDEPSKPLPDFDVMPNKNRRGRHGRRVRVRDSR